MSYLHFFPSPALWAFPSLLDSSADAGGPSLPGILITIFKPPCNFAHSPPPPSDQFSSNGESSEHNTLDIKLLRWKLLEKSNIGAYKILRLLDFSSYFIIFKPDQNPQTVPSKTPIIEPYNSNCISMCNIWYMSFSSTTGHKEERPWTRDE